MWGKVVNYGIMDVNAYAGAAKARLDERGRLAIPARFREWMCGRGDCYLTAHPHDCLAIYGAERFAQICKQLQERPNMSYFDSHLEELVLGNAEKVQVDSADRFLISPILRDYAGVKRDVRLFGLADTVRLWSGERWEQKHTLMMARLQDAAPASNWQDLRL